MDQSVHCSARLSWPWRKLSKAFLLATPVSVRRKLENVSRSCVFGSCHTAETRRQASLWILLNGMQLCRLWQKLPQASAPQSWASSRGLWNWPCWRDGKDRRSQLGRPRRHGHGHSSRTHPCPHHLQRSLLHRHRRLRFVQFLLLQSHRLRRRLRLVQFLQRHRHHRRLHLPGLTLNFPRTRVQGPSRPSRNEKAWSQTQSHLQHPKMRTRSLKHVRCKRKLTQKLPTRFTSFAGSAWHDCAQHLSATSGISWSCKALAEKPCQVDGRLQADNVRLRRSAPAHFHTELKFMQAICQRSSGSGFPASALGGGMLHHRIQTVGLPSVQKRSSAGMVPHGTAGKPAV